MKEIVLRCRNCGRHCVLRSAGQTCDCRVTTGRCLEWHGWAIGEISFAEPDHATILWLLRKVEPIEGRADSGGWAVFAEVRGESHQVTGLRETIARAVADLRDLGAR